MELTNDLLYSVAPYAATLGIEIVATSPAEVTVRIAHRRELETMGGGMHGGALMSLCDVASALCAAMNVGDDAVATTAESATHFLRPLLGAEATATARPLKIGRTLICVEIDVHDPQGRHCVRTTQMLAVQPAAR